MKKLIFGALIALLALLILPGAVSAAEDSDTVTISGSIGLAVDVSVSPASINFDTMSTGVEESGQTTVSLTTTSASWSVTAADLNAATKGFMYRAGPVPLVNALRFGKTANPTGTLVADMTDFMAGTAPITGATQVAYIEQDIAATDASGSYTMTITFTATAN